MKKSIVLMTLLISLQCGADTVLYRATGVSVSAYQENLKTSVAYTTPMSILEQRLQTEELPPSLRRALSDTLTQVALRSDQSAKAFEKLYVQLEAEPRSAAIRDTMRMILERLQSGGHPERHEWIEERLSLLRSTQKDQRQNRQTFLQSEIGEKLRVLKALPGGEDVELFWNGLRWDGGLPISPDQDSQWILVSSQWQPRLLNGTWSQVLPRFEEPFLDWVSGSCQSPVFHSLSMSAIPTARAVFPANCQARQDQLSTTSSAFNLDAPTPVRSWRKTALWGTGILATGLVILAMSGKKISIRPNSF